MSAKQFMVNFLAISLTFSLMVGCNKSEEHNASGKSTSATTKKLVIGVVYDDAGRGDKSFNDGVYEGIKRAEKEFGIQAKHIDSANSNDYEPNLTALCEENVDLIVAVGIALRNAIEDVSKKFPDQKIAFVDGNFESTNVRSLSFKEEQGSFLAGYLAGLMTKTDKIGFIGGMELPIIKKFQCGYEAGAITSNPKCSMLPAKYLGSWDNTDKAQTVATMLYRQGADIIYHAAAKAGMGVFVAAEKEKKFAIGVDSDQDYIKPGFILTSMVKHIDEAVFQSIKDLEEGKFAGGIKLYGLENNGVGLSEMKFTKDTIGTENLAKIDEIKKKIVEGAITVPSNESQLEEYKKSLKSQ